MCEPISLSMVAIAAAQAGASYMQQSAQVKSRDKANRANFDQQMETFGVQQEQVNKNSTDQMSQRAREAQIESARLRAVNGESGLAGGSNDRILNESFFNTGTDMASIEANRSAQQKQLIQEAKSIRAGAQTSMSQIQRPSLIGTGLQIAGAAATAATRSKMLKAPRGDTLPDSK